jgi:hypothetical protein
MLEDGFEDRKAPTRRMFALPCPGRVGRVGLTATDGGIGTLKYEVLEQPFSDTDGIVLFYGVWSTYP